MIAIVALVLLVAALVAFLLATFGLPARINIGWLGAALATIALIIGNWPGANA